MAISITKSAIKTGAWLTQALAIAAAVAIIVITFVHLTDVPTAQDAYTNATALAVNITDASQAWQLLEEFTTANCALGPPQYGHSLCAYAYAAAGVSIIASFVISFVLCCTCELCGMGFLLETTFGGAGALWWFVASTIFSENAREANQLDLERQGWRNSVAVLSWCAFSFFLVLFVIYLAKMHGKLKQWCCVEEEEDGSEPFFAAPRRRKAVGRYKGGEAPSGGDMMMVMMPRQEFQRMGTAV